MYNHFASLAVTGHKLVFWVVVCATTHAALLCHALLQKAAAGSTATQLRLNLCLSIRTDGSIVDYNGIVLIVFLHLDVATSIKGNVVYT